jgi:hypothetical protein
VILVKQKKKKRKKHYPGPAETSEHLSHASHVRGKKKAKKKAIKKDTKIKEEDLGMDAYGIHAHCIGGKKKKLGARGFCTLNVDAYGIHAH